MISKVAGRLLGDSRKNKIIRVAVVLAVLAVVAGGLYIFAFRDKPEQSAKNMDCGQVSEVANDLMDQFKYTEANNLLRGRYSECVLDKDNLVALAYGARTAVSYYEIGDKEHSKQISLEILSILSTVSDKDKQAILDRYSVFTDAIFDISRDTYSGIGGIE